MLKFKLWFYFYFFGRNVKFLCIARIFGDSPLGNNKCAAKVGFPLLILVHCILVRVHDLLMRSFMPFNESLNPHNQTLSFLFAFCLYWFSIIHTFKRFIATICVFKYVNYNVMVFSHNHTWLHIHVLFLSHN